MPRRTSPDIRTLKGALEALYREFDFKGRAAHDPISIPMRYRTPQDMEVSGFIAAAYAYGRVELFLPVLGRIMKAMGKSPHGFVMDFSPRRHARLLEGIAYRFNKPSDLVGLLYALRAVLKKHGSLEDCYLAHCSEADADIGPGLGGLMAELKEAGLRGAFNEKRRAEGFAHFFPSPATGGAAKRGALFMRWMVRRRDIDFGLWKRVSPARLVIPLDTHMARICRCLGLTSRKSNDWKAALEITNSLRAFDPGDPVRFDFALCHRGIAGICSKAACETCALGKLRKH